MKKASKRRKLERRRVKRALARLVAADAAKSAPQPPAAQSTAKRRGAKRKYATEAEAKEAARLYQAAYRKARRDGTWVRKNKVRSTRIAEKLGIAPEVAKPKEEKRAARERRLRETGLKKAARQARREFVKMKYGFDPATFNKEPQTPEAIEGRRRWERDREAEYRDAHRERITAYNREYRRKRRAAQLAERQKSWTDAEWEAWRMLQAQKECAPGSPHWLVREVVKSVAAEGKRPTDDVMAELIANGGVDFLVAGAKSLGKARTRRRTSVSAAVDALRIWTAFMSD